MMLEIFTKENLVLIESMVMGHYTIAMVTYTKEYLKKMKGVVMEY
jgi:hypothetical protein